MFSRAIGAIRKDRGGISQRRLFHHRRSRQDRRKRLCAYPRRAKDLIISGGFNVYPKEVEAEIDALAGVIESAVIGLPHGDFGEGVAAIVVPAPGASLDEQAVQDALSKNLAKFKLPKRVIFVDELPRNAMGKVQKNLCARLSATCWFPPGRLSLSQIHRPRRASAGARYAGAFANDIAVG